MSSQKYKSKADLLIKIKQIIPLLNGRYIDGSKATFESGFKYARYAIILLAAISLPSFSYHTRKIGNTTFVSYYSLYKVAKILGLDFERNRAAPNAYDELSHRGHVKIVFEYNRTFITFTTKGKKNCEDILEDLQLLNEYFNLHSFIRHKYKERAEGAGGITKGGEPRRRSGVEEQVDRLIRKISHW